MRTLENFFKNGLTNNLTNRVFKTFYGTLYEETEIAGSWAGRSFHDLIMSRHMSPGEFRRAIEQQGGVLPEKFLGPTTMLHSLPEEGKGMFDKPYVEQSPNQLSNRALNRINQLGAERQLAVCLETTPEEVQENVERIAGHSFQAIGRSMRDSSLRAFDVLDIHRPACESREDELRRQLEQLGDRSPIIDARTRLRPQDVLPISVDSERSWPVTGALVNETSTRKWLYDGGADVEVDRKYQEAIWYLVHTRADFLQFVKECLEPLHLIRGSDMNNLPDIGAMDSATFGRYVRGVRPYREATTSIIAAMRMVKSYMPEATYVWFDGDLRWHYLDSKLEQVKWEQDNRMQISMLEEAVLEAADRGILNQPMKPDLAWQHPMA